MPIIFKKMKDEGTLVLFYVFIKTTLANMGENAKISVSAWNGTTLE